MFLSRTHKIFKLFLFVCLSVLFNFCETNPPTNSLYSEQGFIIVESNVSGALIFLNDKNTNKVTPDTISAPAGINNVKLIKEGFNISFMDVNVNPGEVEKVIIVMSAMTNKVVLLEDFSNVSCQPCIQSNNAIEFLKNDVYGRSKLISIKYATDFPSRNDPMYLDSSEDSDARMEYYNILFTPTVIVDGILKPISTDSVSIRGSIDSRTNLTPQFAISLNDSVSGNEYFINSTITLVSNSSVDLQNSKVYIIISESEISYDQPPGSNGETRFYDVMREILPNKNGQLLNQIEVVGDNESFNLKTTLKSNWNKEKIETIIFIQNDLTKEIYQSSSTHE